MVGLLILRVRTDRGPSAPATVSPPYTFRNRNICCFFGFFVYKLIINQSVHAKVEMGYAGATHGAHHRVL